MSSWAVIRRRLHPKYIHTSHSWDKEEETGQDTVWQVATGNPNKVKLRSRVARTCLGRKCIWAKGSKKVNVDETGGSEWPMLVPQPRHKWRSCLRGLKNKRALQAPLTPQALKLTQGSGGADAVFGSRYPRKDGDQPIRLNSDHHLTSSIHHRG